MQITILNVTKQSATGPSGKPYTKLEVAYKDSFGKVASKTVMPFGTTKPAFDALSDAKASDVFTLTTVKNDKGYIDWTAATQAAPGTTMASNNQQTSNAVNVKSNYETAEERAKRQVLIVRQSSLSTAATVLSAGAKTSPSSDSVIELAEKFYSWVMQDPTSVVAQDIFKLPNDIEVL